MDEKKFNEIATELLQKFGVQYKEEVTSLLKSYGDTLTQSILSEVEGKLKAIIPAKEPINDDAIKGKAHGFNSFGEYVKSVAGRKDERLYKGLQTSVQGEFIIPENYASEIFKVALSQANLFSRTRRFTVSGNTLNIPYRVDKNHTSGNVLGGLSLYWTEAGGTISPTDLKFGKVALRLNKLAGLIPADNEFMEDAPMGVDTLVRDVFGEAVGFELDRVLVKGTGAGQPLGFKNATALVSAAAVSGQTAATINVQNVLAMYAKLWTGSRSNAVWMHGADSLPQLLAMTLGDMPVYLPGNNVFGRPTDTLLGRPAFEFEHCEALGTAGDIYLVDFSQYITIEKGANFAESMHLYFDTDKTAFRITLRVDGQPWWETYLTLPNSVTQSPFVNLATRS